MESTTPTPSEPKYQVKDSAAPKGGKKDKKPKEESKTVNLNQISLEDYKTFDEAAEAISAALSTYQRSDPSAIKETVINYLKK